jgi:ATP-dependent HslUV protease ATP-binding subunit HslU
VGRDVESIVRDLTDLAIQLVTEEEKGSVMEKARGRAEERVLDALLPPPPPPQPAGFAMSGANQEPAPPSEPGKGTETREKLRRMLREGALDEREVEVDVAASSGGPTLSLFTPQGVEEMGVQFKDLLGGLMPQQTRRRRMKVPAALEAYEAEEANKLVDADQVRERAVSRVEQSGIVFIDEIDKVAGGAGARQGGPDVSREGVQRDLLPIVEGSTVQTRYGYVRTDHVLFIAAGAFHVSKPSDLIPELQGRFPIRVELNPLTEQDFIRIMTEPENALTKQYKALVGAEGAELEFTADGVAEIARVAFVANDRMENIGARRLRTVMTTRHEDVMFDLPEAAGQSVLVDRAFVQDRLK